MSVQLQIWQTYQCLWLMDICDVNNCNEWNTEKIHIWANTKTSITGIMTTVSLHHLWFGT
jgi:hypothetical protein